MKFEGQLGWGHQPRVATGGSELVWSIYVVQYMGNIHLKNKTYFLKKNMI